MSDIKNITENIISLLNTSFAGIVLGGSIAILSSRLQQNSDYRKQRKLKRKLDQEITYSKFMRIKQSLCNAAFAKVESDILHNYTAQLKVINKSGQKSLEHSESIRYNLKAESHLEELRNSYCDLYEILACIEMYFDLNEDQNKLIHSVYNLEPIELNTFPTDIVNYEKLVQWEQESISNLQETIDTYYDNMLSKVADFLLKRINENN